MDKQRSQREGCEDDDAAELPLPLEETPLKVNQLLSTKPDVEAVKRILSERFPALDIQTIAYLEEGLDNRAYVVNGTLIFRIPKNTETAKHLRSEVGTTPLVQRYTSFPVPKYEYVHQGKAQEERCIAGSQLFHGEQLTPEKFRTLPFDKRQNFLADVAHFLRDIHSVPTEEALQCPGVYETNDEGMYRWYAETFFPNNIFPALKEDEQQRVAACLQSVLDKENFSQPKKLLHGDFKMKHLFLNPDTSHIQGVIDFDPMVGDPDYDFMRLAAEIDRDSLRTVLKAYGHPHPVRCERKVRPFLLCRYAQKAHDFRSAGKKTASAVEWEKMKNILNDETDREG